MEAINATNSTERTIFFINLDVYKLTKRVFSVNLSVMTQLTPQVLLFPFLSPF